jgi:L1 cell adhesion molecule like protein
MSKEDYDLSLGIDLGTTYSCVAYWWNGKVDVIPNETGARITPSIVSFTKTERIIGDGAKAQAVRNFENTVYDAKRLIGRTFDDPEVQKDIKLWPFKVINDPETKKPKMQVKFKEKIETFFPEEISSFILSKMKQIAKDYIGKEVTDAIVTCPAYFNDLQRKATQMAGKLAGLNVIRIINEPTAAAIAYGLINEENKTAKNVLIFDLGGGTFDVTILHIDGTIFEVKSTCGDMHLGGEDFDNVLVEHCINEFKEQTGHDISKNQKAIRRLKSECEKMKKNLSTQDEVTLDLDALAEGEDFQITIARPEFQDMCKSHFDKTIPIVQTALKDANLKKEQIDEIVLVGGSTRIPKIQQMVKEFFNKEPCKKVHPDEAVAIGAAIQGAITNNVDEPGLEKLILLDVTPLSLGLELSSGKMDILIKKNTTIPCENTQKYKTTKDNQNKISVKVYQGERVLAKENKYLGKCDITNIPPLPKGKVIVEVTFSLDINGSLLVTAKEKSGGKTSDLTINMDTEMSEEKIEELITRAQTLEAQDLIIIETTRIRTQLQDLCIDLKSKGNEKQKKKAEEIYKWVRKHIEESKETYLKKIEELKSS